MASEIKKQTVYVPEKGDRSLIFGNNILLSTYLESMCHKEYDTFLPTHLFTISETGLKTDTALIQKRDVIVFTEQDLLDFAKRIAGEAWKKGKDYGVAEMKEWGGGPENERPDRETYINNLKITE